MLLQYAWIAICASSLIAMPVSNPHFLRDETPSRCQMARRTRIVVGREGDLRRPLGRLLHLAQSRYFRQGFQ